jgi:hypothetical protein
MLHKLSIILRDLSKYDELMEGLVDEGINKVIMSYFNSS